MSCWRQALFCLAWCRERRDIALTGRGFGISQATAYRYLDEAIDVLAACTPDLTAAPRPREKSRLVAGMTKRYDESAERCGVLPWPLPI